MDQRTGVGWTHGQPIVMVDGAPYALASAVTSDPFDRLAELMKTAHPIARQSPQGDAKEPRNSRRWQRAALLGVGALPILLLLGAWLARIASPR